MTKAFLEHFTIFFFSSIIDHTFSRMCWIHGLHDMTSPILFSLALPNNSINNNKNNNKSNNVNSNKNKIITAVIITTTTIIN